MMDADKVREQVASFQKRDDIARLLKPGGIGVELGVAAGDFSARILEKSDIGFLFSIDMWAGDRGHGVDEYKLAIRRLYPHRTRNTPLRMRFDEALDLFPDGYFDFVYVDGYAHTGEENGATIRNWYPKVARGGILAGDDYHADWPLVVKAVDDFVKQLQLPFFLINCRENTWNSKYPTWFTIKP
jgi:Methyltransferase domain